MAVCFPFSAVGAVFYATAKVNAARFSGVSFRRYAAHIVCRWCRLSPYGEGKCAPFFGHWCGRYAAHFTAVGAAFYTTVRENAARFCQPLV